jgi:hypothetical protein
MLWRLGACALVAGLAWRMFAPCPSALRLGMASATLLVTQSAWDPSAALLGLLGVWLVDRLAHRQNAPWALLALVSACWANLAPGALLAPAVFLAARTSQQRGAITLRDCGLVSLMLLALCLTPRGWWTWRDSLMQLAPQLAAESSVLAQTAWRPLWHEAWRPEFVAWCVLLIAGVMVARRVPAIALAFSLLAAWASWPPGRPRPILQ